MARIHKNSVLRAYEIVVGAIGSYSDDGAEFRKYVADSQPPVIPTRQNIQNEEVGDGQQYDKQSIPDYFDPINIPETGFLKNTTGAIALRDFLGGAIATTDNTVAHGTKDHVIQMLFPGEEPLVRNFIELNGGASYLFGDVFVETLSITQQGGAKPRISVSRQNGGHHLEIGDTLIDDADFDDVAAYKFFDGKLTRITFSDGTTSYNFAGEKRLIDVSFEGNQNVQVEQLPADTALDASAECQGGFSTNLTIDKQTAMIKVKVYMDENFTEFASWKANKKLSSVILKFQSCEIIGTTTHKAELEVKFPVGEFNLAPDQNANYQAYTFDIKAIEGDATTGSLVIGRVRMVGDLDE